MIDRSRENLPTLPPQENPHQPSFIERILTRRKFIDKSKVAVGAIIAADAAIRITIANKFKAAVKELVTRERGKINLIQEVVSFLNAPGPDYLIADCYNLNREITLQPDTLQNVAWFVFGDSMNLAYGKHTGPEDQTSPKKVTQQKDSWVQILVNGVNKSAHFLGIQKDKEWKAYNLARLGSSTIGLVDNDHTQTDGNVQLGNGDVQQWITKYEGKPIVAIGLNGNNWRETAAYVIGLYDEHSPKHDPAFKKFLEAINQRKPIVQIVTDCLKILNDNPKLTDELNTIFKLHEKDSKEFAQGFKKAVEIVDKINQKRRSKRKGLPEVTLVCTLPINLGLRDVAPYAPPGSMQASSFNYADVPNSREAIYRITTTIYQSANQVLREYAAKKTGDPMEIITVPFFGAENNNNFFDIHGHFTPTGEKFVGEKILARLGAWIQGIHINLATAVNLSIQSENPERIAPTRRDS